MCLSLPKAPQASQTSLRADSAYIEMLAAQSTWPSKYVFSVPTPCTPLAFPIQGLRAPKVGSDTVVQYNELLPAHFRVKTRASQNRPSTELFGTSAYTAVGRGLANHVDASTALRHSHPIRHGTSRAYLSELTRNSNFLYVDVPEQLRALPGQDLRIGATTRVGPSYAQPRDE